MRNVNSEGALSRPVPDPARGIPEDPVRTATAPDPRRRAAAVRRTSAVIPRIESSRLPAPQLFGNYDKVPVFRQEKLSSPHASYLQSPLFAFLSSVLYYHFTNDITAFETPRFFRCHTFR